jgi:SAM-dependent methyltransferase
MERTILLVAAGHSRDKKLFTTEQGDQWNGRLVTVDINPNCGANVIHDMAVRPFPFADAEFDEIHAYDCLEHWGTQGDWRGWFDEMREYRRILKPGGTMSIVVPVGEDRFADPGHVRFFSMNHFHFLDQNWYAGQIKAGTSAADYRWYWKDHFQIMNAAMLCHPHNNEPHHLGVILKKCAPDEYVGPDEVLEIS